MRQKGVKTKYPGIESLSDGSHRIVAKAIDPKTGKPRFKEKLTRELEQADGPMSLNDAVAYRAKLIHEIKTGKADNGVPVDIPRLVTLCSSSWITFVNVGLGSEWAVETKGKMIQDHILSRWGDHFIHMIAVGDIDAWVQTLSAKYNADTVRHIAGLFRLIVGKARGQYGLPPIDWDLVTLPAVSKEHAEKNRLNEEQIAAVLPVVRDKFPFSAPSLFTLYSTALRYCHGLGLEWSKLGQDGIVKVDRMFDDKHNEYRDKHEKKWAPDLIALEPRTLEMVRSHRRWMMDTNHPGLETGLLFPSDTGHRPIGGKQLNIVFEHAQKAAGIDGADVITVHGLRHTFHDIARRQGVPDAVVMAMAGRSGTRVVRDREVTSGTHLHYSQGVTVEEMRQASIAVMSVVPTRPVGTLVAVPADPGMDSGRDEMVSTGGRDGESVAIMQG